MAEPVPGPVDSSREAVLARLQRQRREQERAPVQIPGWLVLAALAVVAVLVWRWYGRLGVAEVPLCVVNTSSAVPFEIRLDGKPVGIAPRMAGEDPKAALVVAVAPGPHEVEARNAPDHVAARESFTVEKGSHGYLWTPLPDPNFYFLLQTTEYGYAAGRAGNQRLDGTGPLRPLPAMVTQWFRDNPKTVSVRKGVKSDFERALRRANPPE